MADAYLLDAVRTPVGRRNGVLAHLHAVDLAAAALGALAGRSGLDPAAVDDVVLGCATQVGEQTANLARNAVLAAGWPEHVPAVTVDRQGASSHEALLRAAQAVQAGAADVVVAAGAEAMSRVPLGAAVVGGRFGMPFGPVVAARYADAGGLVPAGVAAELVARRHGLGREALDAWAERSHRRAVEAVAAGRFDAELVAVAAAEGPPVLVDEGVAVPAAGVLAALQPAFVPDGVVTAGNAAPMADGAAAVLVGSAAAAARLGLRPRARVVATAVVGGDPRLGLDASATATRRVLSRAGLRLDDVDLVEVDEPFAAVVLAWAGELAADPERVNVNGGALALGHPAGAAGARATATLLHELERRGARYGLQVACAAGGLATAAILERA